MDNVLIGLSRPPTTLSWKSVMLAPRKMLPTNPVSLTTSREPRRGSEERKDARAARARRARKQDVSSTLRTQKIQNRPSKEK
jgi:hypothetical protein